MKKLFITLSLILNFSVFADATSEAETSKAQATTAINNSVVMEVHGIVCSFCSVGIRKKLAKFSFIDKKRYKKGLIMDIKNQKITVAINAGETVDIQGMFKAIKSGGYEPVSATITDNSGEQNTVKPEA